MIGIIIGSMIVLILPGYLLSHILFQRLEFSVRLMISAGLNISLLTGISFLLTFISTIFLFKTFTPEIFIGTMAAASLLFSIVLLMKRRRSHHKR